MKRGGEGVCRFCLQTFSGSTVGGHLASCKERKKKEAAEAQKTKKPERIFHIKIRGGSEFWLHIEMKASAKLSDLDEFLRDIWLQCCDHLSQFKIRGQSYMPSYVDGMWGLEGKPMGVQLGRVLDVKDKFDYEYDFGSTTYLEGQVVSERQGVLKEKVRILARNRMPEAICAECGKQAARFCTDCMEFYCSPCLDEHTCGEETALPVVNSPRMGVCGYTGDQDPDTFEQKPEDPARAARRRDLPKLLEEYLEERRKRKENAH